MRALYRTAQKGFEETRAEQTALCDHLREETGSLHATSVVRVCCLGFAFACTELRVTSFVSHKGYPLHCGYSYAVYEGIHWIALVGCGFSPIGGR